MATITGLWQTLFRLAPRLPGSDRELLARFAATRDQPAFTELVRRHGGLVWSVCRRHLREQADAEDAFQATFLVLATRPQAVRRAESLGAWLHGTAWRVSARLRRQRGRTLPEADRPAPPDDPSLRDALVALDEELVRLPAKFREPLTACYLLERTQDEAARDLGVSVRTVKRRLATGRELLRQRLGRRGVELGAVLAALALRAPDAPAVLVQTTLTAAALGAASATVSPLVQGVLVIMWQAKLKAWAVGLGLTAATLGGTGYLATTGVGQGPGGVGAGPAKVEMPAAKAAEPPAEPTMRKGQIGQIYDPVEELLFDIDRAKLQIQRADLAIQQDKVMQGTGGMTVTYLQSSSMAGLQAKEDKLVAERNLKLAERKLAAIKGQPVAATTPMSAELRKLREQQVKVLTLMVRSFEDTVKVGVFPVAYTPVYIDLSGKLAEAEMLLVETRDQKIALSAKHRDRMKEFRVYSGQSKVADMATMMALHQARAAELAAEIRLLELGAK